jgi:hypothetical protein
MTKLYALFWGACFPGALLFACATDNGDAVHGQQFGPVPERPDGATDGPVSSDEGGPMPGPDGGLGEAGGDAAPDGPPVTPCTAGTIAVLAGTDTTLTSAIQIKGGTWSGAAVASGAATSPPALVSLGTGFVGLVRGASDALQAVSYAGTWSAATAVGANTALSTPALAVLGTKVEAAVREGAPDVNQFYRVENAGTSWDGTADPVTPPMGTQSFGLGAPAIAAVGTELVLAQDGTNNGLYVQSWDGAVWSGTTAITGAGTLASGTPALLSLTGTFDLVLLYPDNTANNVIGFATRNAGSKAWSNGAVTQGAAMSSEPLSVTSLSATTLLVTFRGNNQRPYFMIGTLGATTIAWTVPAALLPDASSVDSPPAIAKGVCGDDAVAVYASGGQIKATRYRANAWSAPESVSGASGSRVSVATH